MKLTLPEIEAGFKNQEISILAKTITLIESEKEEDQALAQKVLDLFYQENTSSIRLGISGTPGVGKSTFINQFGMKLIKEGHRVAVLAIDPTSHITGGSILGDKTRMTELSAEKNAFIRPSPSKGKLGGVAKKTRETIYLCEAFGFDRILVETVGVGQSEFEVSDMVDALVMLLQPGAGDELQGIKRGILELVDFILITKADQSIELTEAAKHHYEQSLHVLRSHSVWSPPVIPISSLSLSGYPDWINQLKKFSDNTSMIKEKRKKQKLKWVYEIFISEMNFQAQKKWMDSETVKVVKEIEKGSLKPHQILSRIFHKS